MTSGMSCNARSRTLSPLARAPDVADFIREWVSGRTPLPVVPVPSLDLNAAMHTWARKTGRRVFAVRPKDFVPAAIATGGLQKRRSWLHLGAARANRCQVMVLTPPDFQHAHEGPELGAWALAFRHELEAWNADSAPAATTGRERGFKRHVSSPES
jgi:hypothetical protein